MSASKLRRDIEIVQKALNVDPKEPKTRLDMEAMTDKERFIVKGAMGVTREAMRRAMKEQKVKTLGDVDISKLLVSDEDEPIIEAFQIIWRRHAVTDREYNRRHPIH